MCVHSERRCAIFGRTPGLRLDFDQYLLVRVHVGQQSGGQFRTGLLDNPNHQGSANNHLFLAKIFR